MLSGGIFSLMLVRVRMRLAEKQKILWVTWERQIRNHSMASALGANLYEITSDKGRFLRYISCVSKTFFLLWREKPTVVICQNPSIILTVLLLLLRKIFHFRVVIDAHFGGIDAGNGSNASQSLLDWCNRTANLVIVTNDNHASQVRALDGRAFICPDPLPDLSEYNKNQTEVPKKIFLICSYDIDEPFREVFKAAGILESEGFKLFASGNYRKVGIAPEQFSHVQLLGFVSIQEFYEHLFTAQLVIDLTDNDDCLVCGAYEALEAGKPLILSKKRALQEYFTGGTIFTENRSPEIVSALRNAYDDRRQLAEDSRLWVVQARKAMDERINTLKSILESL